MLQGIYRVGSIKKKLTSGSYYYYYYNNNKVEREREDYTILYYTILYYTILYFVPVCNSFVVCIYIQFNSIQARACIQTFCIFCGSNQNIRTHTHTSYIAIVIAIAITN